MPDMPWAASVVAAAGVLWQGIPAVAGVAKLTGSQSMPSRFDSYPCAGLPGEFQCWSGLCVPAAARCTGIAECDDFSDESGCLTGSGDSGLPPAGPGADAPSWTARGAGKDQAAVLTDSLEEQLTWSSGTTRTRSRNGATASVAASRPTSDSSIRKRAPWVASSTFKQPDDTTRTTTRNTTRTTTRTIPPTTTTRTTTRSTKNLVALESELRNVAETQAKATPCFWKEVTYEPLDMSGMALTEEADVAACQRRCQSVSSCATFAFWEPMKHCHLQDADSVRTTGRVGFTSGPADCTAEGSGDFTNSVMDNIELRYGGCYHTDSARVPADSASPDGSAPVVDNILACQRLCQSISKCSFFTYSTFDRRCHLADAQSELALNVFYQVTGPRDCQDSILFSVVVSNIFCEALTENWILQNNFSSAVTNAAYSTIDQRVDKSDVHAELECSKEKPWDVKVNVAIKTALGEDITVDQLANMLRNTKRLIEGIQRRLAKHTALSDYFIEDDAHAIVTAVSEVVVDKRHPQEWPPQWPEPKKLPKLVLLSGWTGMFESSRNPWLRGLQSSWGRIAALMFLTLFASGSVVAGLTWRVRRQRNTSRRSVRQELGAACGYDYMDRKEQEGSGQLKQATLVLTAEDDEICLAI